MWLNSLIEAVSCSSHDIMNRTIETLPRQNCFLRYFAIYVGYVILTEQCNIDLQISLAHNPTCKSTALCNRY